MLLKLKRYIAIGTLLVFLFPLAVEGLHAMEQSEAISCLSSDHHIHQQEHHCSICDYAPSAFELSFIAIPNFCVSQTAVHYSFFYQTIALFTFLKGSCLRAPPSL